MFRYRRSRSHSPAFAPEGEFDRLGDLRSNATSSCLRAFARTQKISASPLHTNPTALALSSRNHLHRNARKATRTGRLTDAIAFQTPLGRGLCAQAGAHRAAGAAGQHRVLGTGTGHRGARHFHARPLRRTGRRAACGAQGQARAGRTRLRRALWLCPAVGPQPAGFCAVLGGDWACHLAARHRAVRRWLALVPAAVRPPFQVAVRAADRFRQVRPHAPPPFPPAPGAAARGLGAGAAAAGLGAVPVAVRRRQPGDRKLAGKHLSAGLRLDFPAAPDPAGRARAAGLGRAAPASAAPHLWHFRRQRRPSHPRLLARFGDAGAGDVQRAVRAAECDGPRLPLRPGRAAQGDRLIRICPPGRRSAGRDRAAGRAVRAGRAPPGIEHRTEPAGARPCHAVDRAEPGAGGQRGLADLGAMSRPTISPACASPRCCGWPWSR